MSDIFKKAMDALTRGFQYQVNTELRPAESKAILDEIAQLDADLSISREGLRTFDPKFENALMENVELRSLLARMSEVGDELAKKGISNYKDHNEKTLYRGCEMCKSKIVDAWLSIPHSPDCPVTKWETIKKELEG